VLFTESQNHSMVGVWKGPLWVTQSNPPAEAGSPTAGFTAPRPGRSGISPEKETPQPALAACSRAPSPSEGRSSSSCSDGTSYASVCGGPISLSVLLAMKTTRHGSDRNQVSSGAVREIPVCHAFSPRRRPGTAFLVCHPSLSCQQLGWD